MKKINFIIYQDGDQFVSQCLNVDVATQGDNYEEAVRNIHEAVELYLEDNDAVEFRPIRAVTLGEDYVNA